MTDQICLSTAVLGNHPTSPKVHIDIASHFLMFVKLYGTINSFDTLSAYISILRCCYQSWERITQVTTWVRTQVPRRRYPVMCSIVHQMIPSVFCVLDYSSTCTSIASSISTTPLTFVQRLVGSFRYLPSQISRSSRLLRQAFVFRSAQFVSGIQSSMVGVLSHKGVIKQSLNSL